MAITRKLLRQLNQRDGHRSAWTGQDAETLVPHHRVNRGMGGRPSLDRIENLVWLESDINERIEADPEWARIARERGIKLASWQRPEAMVIDHAVHGKVLLTDAGQVRGAGVADRVASRAANGVDYLCALLDQAQGKEVAS
ncbi:MAG: hypothetical protein LBG60_10820 [Bifidobacteriaceae bacterium]|jgi:hypothetical protein|nr:hypothetical protein [Bifidobacteriaceae bacterium]